MKNKYLLLIVVLLICNITYNQQIVLQQELSPKVKGVVMQQILPVVNKSTGDFAMFFDESKTVGGYLFSSQFEEIGSFVTSDIPRRYGDILGYSIKSDSIYTLYASNKNRTQFYTATIDFNKDEQYYGEITPEFDNEIYLHSINYNNQFYIITIHKETSDLYFYLIEDHDQFDRKRVDLSGLEMLNKNNKTRSLYKMLLDRKFWKLGAFDLVRGATHNDLRIQDVDINAPQSLELLVSMTKIYQAEIKLRITFDENRSYTQLLTIDMTDFSWDFQKFEKPLFNTPNDLKKTNSFLYNNYLLAVGVNPNGLAFTIRDINSGNVIKKYTASKDSKIPFSNTPVIQKGAFYDRYRELKNTERLVRKAYKSNVAIYASKRDHKYEITIGGHMQSTQAPIPIMPYNGSMTLGNIKFDMNVNYIYYLENKSFYVTGLFDSKFEHLEGSIRPTVFDRITDYKDERRSVPNNQLVFKYNLDVLWGEYNYENNSYILRAFKP